jgi:filamentous hemagglutinin family protein
MTAGSVFFNAAGSVRFILNHVFGGNPASLSGTWKYISCTYACLVNIAHEDHSRIGAGKR